jgi:hypothetical protein
VVRQKGSHQRLENPQRPRNAVTVAVHAGRDLPEGTLRAILRRAGLSREEFECGVLALVWNATLGNRAQEPRPEGVLDLPVVQDSPQERIRWSTALS